MAQLPATHTLSLSLSFSLCVCVWVGVYVRIMFSCFFGCYCFALFGVHCLSGGTFFPKLALAIRASASVAKVVVDCERVRELTISHITTGRVCYALESPTS